MDDLGTLHFVGRRFRAGDNSAGESPKMCDAADDLVRLAQSFLHPGVVAVALLGSHARGDAGPESDVDLLRLTAADPPADEMPDDAGSHLRNGRLVVVSDAGPAALDGYFQHPQQAVSTIQGLRTGRALLDSDGHFARLQGRARAFVWDAAMQERANRYVSRQMVGWVEEVLKGVQGLRTGHVGRLLNARFGLSWGLTDVMQVYHGVLAQGDNHVYAQVRAAVGDPRWLQLHAQAFAVADHHGGLATQVAAGLQLYILTVRLVDDAIRPQDRPLIDHAVAAIRQGADHSTQTNGEIHDDPSL